MKPTKKQLIVYIVSLVLVCALTFGITFGVMHSRGYVPSDAGIVSYAKLEKILAIYREYSLYGLPEGVDLTELLAQSIVYATEDRYDAYFTVEGYDSYQEDLAGKLVGIGVLVEKPETDACESVRILSAFAGSPAEAAGLRSGDRLTAVNGVPFRESGYADGVEKIAGDAGTQVEITYVRGDDPAEHTVTVTRAACDRQTVYTDYDPATGIGYIRITEFDAVTTSQFIRAVSALEEAGVGGIVFDVRANGGGLLLTVSEMLAYLLPDGVIATVDYKSDKLGDFTIRSEDGVLYYGSARHTKDSLGNDLQVGHQLTVPCAVLTNGGTASAAELFTSALRDWAAGDGFVPVTLIGANTYGKGTMQSTFPLGDGTYIKMTVARYNPPCGVNYDGVGIAPGTDTDDRRSTNELYLIDPAEDITRQTAFRALARNAQ